MNVTVKGFEFDDSIVVNPREFIPSGEYNPHHIRPWLIHNEYGPLCVVFASCEQDALDEAADSDKLDSCLIAPEDYEEHGVNSDEPECAFLGNASEPFDLTYIGIIELPNPKFSFCALLSQDKE